VNSLSTLSACRFREDIGSKPRQRKNSFLELHFLLSSTPAPPPSIFLPHLQTRLREYTVVKPISTECSFVPATWGLKEDQGFMSISVLNRYTFRGINWPTIPRVMRCVTLGSLNLTATLPTLVSHSFVMRTLSTTSYLSIFTRRVVNGRVSVKSRFRTSSPIKTTTTSQSFPPILKSPSPSLQTIQAPLPSPPMMSVSLDNVICSRIRSTGRSGCMQGIPTFEICLNLEFLVRMKWIRMSSLRH
jgi:hypothetical protein